MSDRATLLAMLWGVRPYIIHRDPLPPSAYEMDALLRIGLDEFVPDWADDREEAESVLPVGGSNE